MNDALHILQHSLGLDEFARGVPYRNHFVTGPGSDGHALCVAMIEQGLMTRTKGNAITGGADVFRVTDAGRRYVVEHSPKPPRLTRAQRRYRDFLDEDSDLRFGQWLKARGAR